MKHQTFLSEPFLFNAIAVPNAIGGNSLIKNALQGSQGKPTDDLDFCVGYLIVGGGPSMKVMNGLLGSL